MTSLWSACVVYLDEFTVCVGGQVLDQPLTVVLPMHNCERQLRSSVLDILDLTSSVTRMLQIVVVDDGSTDDTYETACELARLYPQLTVLRQPVRQGLGAALDLVRNRLAVEMVIVHDGVSTIDVAQLQMMLQEENANRNPVEKAEQVSDSTMQSTMQSSGSRRFAAVRALHDRMEQAHRSATCFRWMQLEKPLVPRRCQTSFPSGVQEEMPAQGMPIAFTNLPTGMGFVPQD